jgi:hypothetical protein
MKFIQVREKSQFLNLGHAVSFPSFVGGANPSTGDLVVLPDDAATSILLAGSSENLRHAISSLPLREHIKAWTPSVNGSILKEEDTFEVRIDRVYGAPINTIGKSSFLNLHVTPETIPAESDSVKGIPCLYGKRGMIGVGSGDVLNPSRSYYFYLNDAEPSLIFFKTNNVVKSFPKWRGFPSDTTSLCMSVERVRSQVVKDVFHFTFRDIKGFHDMIMEYQPLTGDIDPIGEIPIDERRSYFLSLNDKGESKPSLLYTAFMPGGEVVVGENSNCSVAELLIPVLTPALTYISLGYDNSTHGESLHYGSYENFSSGLKPVGLFTIEMNSAGIDQGGPLENPVLGFAFGSPIFSQTGNSYVDMSTFRAFFGAMNPDWGTNASLAGIKSHSMSLSDLISSEQHQLDGVPVILRLSEDLHEIGLIPLVQIAPQLGDDTPYWVNFSEDYGYRCLVYISDMGTEDFIPSGELLKRSFWRVVSTVTFMGGPFEISGEITVKAKNVPFLPSSITVNG